MPIFLSPRFAMLLLVAMPLMGGAAVHPQGASAFLIGAWTGVLLVGPPLMILLWIMGLRSIGEILRPLASLPILIGLTMLVLYLSGTDVGLGGQLAGGAGLLWWLRRGRSAQFI